MAEYVARNGGNFEDMVREREKDNKMLSFLFSGELHEYVHSLRYVDCCNPPQLS